MIQRQEIPNRVSRLLPGGLQPQKLRQTKGEFVMGRKLNVVSEAAIRKHFGGCTFPELCEALRNLDGVLFERVESAPAKCAREQAAETRRREAALRHVRLVS